MGMEANNEPKADWPQTLVRHLGRIADATERIASALEWIQIGAQRVALEIQENEIGHAGQRGFLRRLGRWVQRTMERDTES